METKAQFLFSDRIKLLQQLGPEPGREEIQKMAAMYKVPEGKLQKWVNQYDKYVLPQRKEIMDSDDDQINKLIQEQRQLCQELSALTEQINEIHKKKLFYYQ
ncbi:unnamed protein product (macronuclear) [Paramecium tetraurelia]|uniref:HTH psq-type domain-containing protein n=1 Tax=Paramecium tetraurelia TaxID=5888 RepID=A0DKZ2_PARTE|nr:uncharacterized protein GSPATT00018026001 [Paramecium tetraurelia]CAK83709.1 unnamed protein product [Paramecium tetraurelia]|eukprot:XP_001451106.1 hypothetical protein (macronuclear) [Paramecium tetraurelia strain d4-2]